MRGAALLRVPKPSSCGSFFSKLSGSLRPKYLFLCLPDYSNLTSLCYKRDVDSYVFGFRF
jgi:hypothetical protein